jgi:DNA-binding transcriptional LysR family regulator
VPRALGVNHTTVLRWLNGLEGRMGVRLFERLPTGHALTGAGEEVLAVARGVGATVATLERRLLGRDLRLSGTLRVATTDTLVLTILMPHLAVFRAAHPGIELDVTLSNAMTNLTQRDADVAVRPADNPPEALVGRRVATIAYAVYGAVGYLARHTELGELGAHSWVAPDDSLAATATARWMRQVLPPATAIACRLDSLLALREAVRAGLGLALLPCYLGDGEPGLGRVGGPRPEVRSGLWLLTHEDLRRTARVRAFTEFMAGALAGERDLLEGQRLP